MNTRRIVGLLTAGLILSSTAACSSSDKPTPTASPTTKSQAAPATKGKANGPLKLGTRTHWSGIDGDGSPISGTTTALNYTQPATGVDLPDEAADFKNPTWAILEVKLCADDTSTTILTSQGPWALGFPDDTRLQAPGLSGSGVPKPEYPSGDGSRVAPGRCLRGKITFSLEGGTKPDMIVYAPEGRDPIEWEVPKA
ncbi:hypothetical protein [Streptomyces sp. NPDC057460]|uniref:hypothetical protein n=1 Tax=Streptomyces sp. NPDC057460 TaxID=3346141 RepID=UPI0036AAE44B